MPKLFISYSRVNLPFVVRLAQDLRALGLDLWLDVEQISAGDDWTDAVWEGLKTCTLMLLVLSPDSMGSQEVASEWKYFLNNRKPIIPLLAEPTPHIHYQISALQYVDFHNMAYEAALRHLQAEIALKLGIGTGLPEPNTSQGITGALPDDQPQQDDPWHTVRVNREELRQVEEQLHYFDSSTLLELKSYGQGSWSVQLRLPEEREFIIGRGADDGSGVDLAPAAAAAYGISRRHAALKIEDNTLFIRDLNSTNFTYVEGQRLRPNEQRALKSGDRIQLGNMLLIIYFQNP